MTEVSKKKNSEIRDTEAFIGIDTEIVNKLKEKGILNEIEAVFGDKTAAFIRQHVYLNKDKKIVIKSLDVAYRDAIIGLKVWDIGFNSMKYVILNKFIVIKIANYSAVYDAIENKTAQFSDFVIKKQKNGSMRLQNVNRTGLEIEID